jgi:hypothetical protein
MVLSGATVSFFSPSNVCPAMPDKPVSVAVAAQGTASALVFG